MWGSSFADLAKKAQEQAAAAASTVRSPSLATNFSGAGSLFNLDSMQAEEDSQNKTEQSNASSGRHDNVQPQPPTISTPVNNALSYGFTSPVTPLVTPVKRGTSASKLVVPTKPTSQLKRPVSTGTTQLHSSSSVVKLRTPSLSVPQTSQAKKHVVRSGAPTKLAVPKRSTTDNATTKNAATPAPSSPSPTADNPTVQTESTPKPSSESAPAASTTTAIALPSIPTADTVAHDYVTAQTLMKTKPIGVDNIPRQKSNDVNDASSDSGNNAGSTASTDKLNQLDMPIDPMLETLDKVHQTDQSSGNDVPPAVPEPTLDQLPSQEQKTAQPLPPPSLDQLDQSAHEPNNTDTVLQPPAPSLDQLPPQANDADNTSLAVPESSDTPIDSNSHADKVDTEEQALADQQGTPAIGSPFTDFFSAATADSISKAFDSAETLPDSAEPTNDKRTIEDSAGPPKSNNMKSSGTTKPEVSSEDETSVPDRILEQFSKQLERLEQNHESEMQQLQQQFEHRLAREKQQWQQEQTNLVQQAERSMKEQVTQKMEREWGRKRENFQLRIESLERELEGTRNMLEQRDKAKTRTQDSHLNELRAMESKMNDVQDTADKLKEQVKDLEGELEKSRKTISEKDDEYEALKDRVKAVAGELKERRIENRTLQSEILLLKQANDELQDEITRLQAQGMDKDKSQTEASAELDKLRNQLAGHERDLEDARRATEEAVRKGEEALATYKKKAQSSLSVANSRIASAVQAKEEAEMEARAARSSADIAMERAVKAESEARQKMAESKLKMHQMEEEVAKKERLEKELQTERIETKKMQKQLDGLQRSRDALDDQIMNLSKQLEAEQSKKDELAKTLRDTEDRCNELMEEVDRLSQESSRLREDMQRVVAEKKQLAEQQKEAKPNGYAPSPRLSASNGDRSSGNFEAESTITILRQELQVADQAIRDLKQTLKATIDERDQAVADSNDAGQRATANADAGAGTGTGTGAETIPLFYAMEKQAELAQARNEISRLAALVGDAKAEKQEALERAAQIEEELHQAQSRLQRMEQLGGSLSSAPPADPKATAVNGSNAQTSDGSVNLEYLKNIVLSYLNAKTKQERRTLLPVIGTVLCLTPEEQSQALQRLSEEDSRVVNAVANTLLTNFKWSG